MVEASNKPVVNLELTSGMPHNTVIAPIRVRLLWCLELPRSSLLATIVVSRGTSKGTVISSSMTLELAEEAELADRAVQADLAHLAVLEELAEALAGTMAGAGRQAVVGRQAVAAKWGV